MKIQILKSVGYAFLGAIVSTAIVAPSVYFSQKNKMISVESLFVGSKLYNDLVESEKNVLLEQYKGVFVEKNSEKYNYYVNLFNKV